MEKMGPDGPKWGQEDFYPTNLDLADILGDMDFDFENFHFFDLFFPTPEPKLARGTSCLLVRLLANWAAKLRLD